MSHKREPAPIFNRKRFWIHKKIHKNSSIIHNTSQLHTKTLQTRLSQTIAIRFLYPWNLNFTSLAQIIIIISKKLALMWVISKAKCSLTVNKRKMKPVSRLAIVSICGRKPLAPPLLKTLQPIELDPQIYCNKPNNKSNFSFKHLPQS